ncbi:hypothetical protein BDN72DRAFT_834585 [Pluteus cervinus]|uniref:Uncharacterized protein n=1 Tax=Pluteus cervinus TaxID=181527 RepID=A0ACD3B5U1_9AGAR|nr:hypothetical protein BDN72DRAFT_834585 [Pluteus cervinus]
MHPRLPKLLSLSFMQDKDSPRPSLNCPVKTPIPTEPQDSPVAQPIFAFNEPKGEWIPWSSDGDGAHSTGDPASSGPTPLSHSIPRFFLLTWNIDFMNPLPKERIQQALSHLERLFWENAINTPTSPVIVLLQELHKDCFQPLLAHPFVRTNFLVTDLDAKGYWRMGSYYGTVTLIPKVLVGGRDGHVKVKEVFRTHFGNSICCRDGLYVDLEWDLGGGDGRGSSIPTPPSTPKSSKFMSRFKFKSASTGNQEPVDRKQLIRICNVHLESLEFKDENPRTPQMKSVAQYLQAKGVDVGVMAGDMNVHLDEDRGMPEECGLVDGWKVVKKAAKASRRTPHPPSDQEDEPGEDPIDLTWGFQPPLVDKEPARLDKVLMTGKVTIESLERVGYDLKYEPDLEMPAGGNGEGEEERGSGRPTLWVSDHCGLLAELRLAL